MNSLDLLERIVMCGACFIAGYLVGEAKLSLSDTPSQPDVVAN